MTGIQDSEAHFIARATEYGLPRNFLDRLKAQGVSTLGHPALAVFRPGSEFEERAFNDWATDINNGVPLPMGAAAALRRLHFESEVVLTSAIRASVESPDPGTPKTVPFAEKTARMDELRGRFQGLNIHGIGEPSHALLDEVCSQFETRVLKYVEPQRCTSRELEITTGRSDRKLKLDAGTLAMCALGADVSNCTHSRRRMLLKCQNPMNDYRLQLKVSIKVLMQLCLSCFVERLALAPL